ncbi:hypothetical protein EIP86_004345 [Pleurotus ostreatoroseus]|nr:hypothetical protein EIP86_004345 [Pleurotus ostreatoroseus]
MLLKFATTDLFNSTITDCTTGDVLFRVMTSGTGRRARTRSGSSLYSFASSYASSRERLPKRETTSLFGADGTSLAEITWEDEAVARIRIGEEELAKGNCEIFAVDFVQVFPNETLVPTRMEYVWRLTPDELELLDDDRDSIGMLHLNCMYLKDQLVPATKRRYGRPYLELTGNIPDDELAEVISTFQFFQVVITPF